MKGKFSVACVGAGYFSRFHLDAWARIEGAQVVGVADQSLGAARATGFPAFEDAASLIDAVKPDIVDIILPPASHREAVQVALSRDVKTVICQKPFGASLAEAKTLVKEAKEAGTLLIVHENFRFMPWYRTIKEQLEAGAIGRVLQASFRLRPGDGQGPQAYLDRQPYFQKMQRFLIEETAVHWIDTFRFLLGPQRSLYADLRQLNPVIAGEDAGIVIFEHDEGVRALFDGNRLLDHASDNQRRTMGEALFEGTTGTLTLFGDGRVEHRPFGETTSTVVHPSNIWDGFGGDCVFALQSHVVRGLQGDGHIENTAQEYCDVLRVRDAIYKSAETNMKVQL